MRTSLLCLLRSTLAVALLTWALGVQARHIVGGEVTYECLGDAGSNQRRYRVTVIIYRDCAGNGAEFDSAPNSAGDFEMTIFRGTRIFSRPAVSFRGLTIERLDPDLTNPCILLPPGICVEKGTYVTEVVLPISTETYTISYQRCCRNETISNIVRPGDAGATYVVEITAAGQQTCNSTPTFRQFPPLIICADEELRFDASAVDKEGDRLVYGLCEPYYGGGNVTSAPGNEGFNGVTPNPESPPPYSPIVFRPAFQFQRPIDGSITLDPVTGFLRVRPMTVGQYVVCLSVQEWRGDEMIGEVRRDFQFNVVACDPRINAGAAAIVDADIVNPDLILICGSKDVTLLNVSTDARFVQSISWVIPSTSVGLVRSADSQLPVSFDDYGSYPGQLIVNPGLTCDDTANFVIRLVPPSVAAASFAYDTCVYGPVAFTSESVAPVGGSIVGYQWEFGDGNESDVVDPQHLYRTPGRKLVTHTISDDKGCVADTTFTIDFFPLPIELPLDLSLDPECAPAQVPFRFATEIIDSSYEVLWEFGDGATSTELAPVHFYPDPGIYNIFVSVESPQGCKLDSQLTRPLAILESPISAFTYAPDQVDTRDPEIFFTDRSVEAVSWQWAFDSLGVSREVNPSFVFPDSGRYFIELIVSHLNGCLDTSTQFLRIDPFQSLFLPNALKPDGSGRNERFRPAGFLRYVTEFRMEIYNRWGERIFETDDIESGWDGFNQRNDSKASPGVYLYVVTHSGIEGPQRYEGTVTLVE